LFDDLTEKERIALAKERMENLLGYAGYALALNENNNIVVYSKTLASQIPESFAANAFNVFREAMQHMQIVRVCALWDPPGRDRQSIPTVVKLIEPESVIEALSEEMRDFHANQKQNVASLHDHANDRAFVEERVREIRRIIADDWAESVRQELPKVIAETNAFSDSTELRSLRDFRNEHLAHLLSKTRESKKGRVILPRAKNTWEVRVLSDTIPIVEALYRWINGADHSLDEGRQIDRSYAQALWGGCKFDVE
jgi:HEPN superfamily AbiU2-like protein